MNEPDASYALPRTWALAAWTLLALLALFVIAEEVEASHYRGGTVTWEPTDNTNEAHFTGLFYWRLDFQTWANPQPEVGDVLPIGNFDYGDWDASDLNPNQVFNDPLFMEVTSVNQAGNWFSAKWVDGDGPDRKDGLTHTYFDTKSPITGQAWRASWQDAARLDTAAGHVNNGGQEMALWTYVQFDEENSAPKVILPPITQCVRDTLCEIDIIAGDYEQEDLYLRFATTEEATQAPPIASLPDDSGDGPQTFDEPGLPDAPNQSWLDSDEMKFKWDTTGATDAAAGRPTYYSMQIMVEDHIDPDDPVGAQTPIDVFIQLVDEIKDPPTWSTATPCAETRSVLHDTQVTFPVELDSPIQGRKVTMMDVNKPAGSTMSPVTPVVGDPAKSTFDWTPTEAQLGVYTVLFIGWDEVGTPAENCVVTIRVVDEPPAVDVTWVADDYYTFDAVDFTGSWSHGRMIVETGWDFGDGTTIVTPHAPPLAMTGQEFQTHDYSDDGEYTVNFTVEDDRQLPGFKARNITILNRAPVSHFTASTLTADRDTTITFSDASHDCDGPSGQCDGSLASWSWDFGDGTTSSDPNPSKQYSELGTYTVTLTVTDDDGATHAFSRVIVIENLPPEASAFANPANAYTFDSISFIDSSYDDGGIVSWAWTFGDGETSGLQFPTHSYDDDGTYTVTLTVTDLQGESDTHAFEVTIWNRAPTSAWDVPTPVYADVPFTFTEASHDCNGPVGQCDGNIVSWTWSIHGDDVAVLAGPDGSFDYTFVWESGEDYPKDYPVTLTVVDDDGAVHQLTQFVTVLLAMPVADFTASTFSTFVGDDIQFTDLSTDLEAPIASWYWDFGDGEFSTDQHPVFAFDTTGGVDFTRVVRLTVTDSHGQTHWVEKTFNIQVREPAAQFSMSPNPAKLDELISFTDLSTDPDDGIDEWAWDFGDGNVGAVQNPTHAYTGTFEAAGDYVVTLTVTDEHGAMAQSQQTVTITHEYPVASFTHQAQAYVDETVPFMDTSTDDVLITDWAWDFGDGTTSTLQHPSHEYTTDGTYTVTLIVTDNHGATHTTTSSIDVVYSAPIAQFTVPAWAYVDTTFAVDDASFDVDGWLTLWDWNFGDGTQASYGVQTDPSVSYTTDSGDDFSVQISLTVTDNHGLTNTVHHDVDILLRPPVADFDATTFTPNADDLVTFTDLSSDPDNGIVAWEWDFGDGSPTESSANTDHAFTTTGGSSFQSTVTLTVWDEHGASDSISKVVNVQVHAPVADFTASTMTPDVDEVVTFTDLSSDSDAGIQTRIWEFGVVQETYNVLTHPTRAFGTTAGESFQVAVTLTVVDEHGASDSISKTLDVIVHPPIATFSADDWTPYADTEVVFTDASTDPDNGIAARAWSFGDGNSDFGVGPTHTYGQISDFDVTLTVTDIHGASSTATATVSPWTETPTADFVATPVSQRMDDPIVFTHSADDIDGFIASWHWDFGDGQTSTEENPSHAYSGGVAAEGTFDVTLTVTDNHGATASVTKQVDVFTIPPSATFSADDVKIVGQPVQFTDASTDEGNVVAWLWELDGATYTTQHPSHTFSDDGPYSVTLTVTDNHGRTDSVTETVELNNQVPVAAIGLPSPAMEDAALTFTDLSTDDQAIASWLWDFGDGATSTLQNPSHTYVTEGPYTVTLTVWDSDGAPDTTSASLSVIDPPPAADFGASTYRPLLDQPVDFTDASADNDALTWLWDFGDGATSTAQHPTHTYTGTTADAGTKTVKLTVTDEFGQSHAISKSLIVSFKRPVALISLPPTVGVHEDVTLDGSASYDPDHASGTEFTDIRWEIDGNSAGGAITTSAQFDMPGTYEVWLYLTDKHGAEGSARKLLSVTADGPTAAFNGPSEATVRTDVSFLDASTDDYLPLQSVEWIVGGNIVTGDSLTTQFATVGSHDVTLRVTDSHGLQDSVTKSITVTALAPTAAFDVPGIDAGDMVQFLDASTDPDDGITSWFWQFPHTQAHAQDPTISFPASGTFDVTLTVTDVDGESSSVTHQVVVNNVAPVAGFDAPTEAELGETVTFTDTSTDEQGIVSWVWTIGDESFEGQEFSWTPDDSGSFTVTLTVTDADGETSTTSHTVIVQNPPPVPAFTHAPAYPSEAMQFTDLSTDNREIVTWDWLIDSVAYTTQHPIHVFAVDGTFDVQLTVTDDQGATATTLGTAVVQNPLPVTSFVADDLVAYQELTFTDTSSDDDAFTVTWDFGDGPVEGSTVTHTFPTTGEFVVTHTVTDSDGDSVTTTITFTITSPPPVAAFSYTSPVMPGETVLLVDESSDDGTIVSRTWTTIGNLEGSAVSFDDDGTYPVTLTVTDDAGKSGAVTHSIVVLNPEPIPDFTHGEGVNEEAISFTDTSTDDGSITHSAWYFGDGKTAFGSTVAHSYDLAGSYEVTHLVVDDDGAKATTKKTITVGRHEPGWDIPKVEDEVEEGQGAAFTLQLLGKPLKPVAVHILGDNNVAGAPFTIAPSNWQHVYTFTLTSTQDQRFEGYHTGHATLRLQSDDAAYNAWEMPLQLHIIDDDEATLWFSDNVVQVTATTGERVEVRLGGPPQSDVTIELVAPEGVTLVETNVTFTPTNWGTSQFVGFTVDDVTIFERDPVIIMRVGETEDPHFKELPESALPLQVPAGRVLVPHKVVLSDVDVTAEVFAGQLIPEAKGYLVWIPDGDEWVLLYDVPEPLSIEDDWKVTYYVNRTWDGGYREPGDTPRSLPGWEEPEVQAAPPEPEEEVTEVQATVDIPEDTTFPWWIVALGIGMAGIVTIFFIIAFKRSKNER